MNQLQIVINGETKGIQIKEYKGQRVVTFSEIDKLHERPESTSSRNFGQNKKHFVEGEDYFRLSNKEIQSTNIVDYNSPKGLTLLTESGYLMLVKSFQDDLAWSVQRQLVKSYFRGKENNLDTTQLSPELQMMNQMFQAVAKNEIETKEAKRLAAETEQKVNNISNIVSLSNVEWRDKVNVIIKKIAKYWTGVEPYKSVRNLSYEKMERRAGCKLDIRLNNRKERAVSQGMSKSYVNKINKLDCIEEEKRLVEIYIQVVKEMAIQFRIDINDFNFEGVI